MKKIKATVGERIELKRVRETLGRPALTLQQFRYEALYHYPRMAAKEHDAAIRRAVREVWKARGEYDKCWPGSRIVARIEQKYGVRL